MDYSCRSAPAGSGWGLATQPSGRTVCWSSWSTWHWPVLVGGITLAALRFKPSKAGGYLLPILLGLLCLAALVYFTGLTKVIRDGIIATRRVAPTPTATQLPAVHDSDHATFTPSSSATFTPSSTAQPSATLEPTPSYAVITSPSGGGALVRSEPGAGTVLTVLIEWYHRPGAAGNSECRRHQLGTRAFGTISMAGS